jgi:hypothetical protein
MSKIFSPNDFKVKSVSPKPVKSTSKTSDVKSSKKINELLNECKHLLVYSEQRMNYKNDTEDFYSQKVCADGDTMEDRVIEAIDIVTSVYNESGFTPDEKKIVIEKATALYDEWADAFLKTKKGKKFTLRDLDVESLFEFIRNERMN